MIAFIDGGKSEGGFVFFDSAGLWAGRQREGNGNRRGGPTKGKKQTSKASWGARGVWGPGRITTRDRRVFFYLYFSRLSSLPMP